MVLEGGTAARHSEVKMSTKIAGRELSTGWNAEIERETAPGTRTWAPVADPALVAELLMQWLGLDNDAAASADWDELLQDELNGESDVPAWLIPLDVDHLAELVCNDRYLHEIVIVDNVRFKILIDLSDS
jgi:hypothetical protein